MTRHMLGRKVTLGARSPTIVLGWHQGFLPRGPSESALPPSESALPLSGPALPPPSSSSLFLLALPPCSAAGSLMAITVDGGPAQSEAGTGALLGPSPQVLPRSAAA